jgi:hypothetical protein
MLLYIFLDAIRADQQLMQPDASLVTGAAADVAPLRAMQRDLPLLVAELLNPRRA